MSRAQESSVENADLEQAGSMSLAGMFERRVEETPDALAIRTAVGQLSFVEWHRRAAGISGLLAESFGSLSGERILVWMSNDEAASFVSALEAIFGLAAVAVALDDRSTAPEAKGILCETEPRAVLISDQVMHNLGHRGLEELGLGDPPDSVDSEHAVVLAVRDGRVVGREAEWNPRISPPGDEPLRRLEKPEDDACIFYTSGSTGRPKGAIWTQAGLAQYAERAAHAIYALPRGGKPLQPRDALQSPIPLYTAASMMENLHPGVFSGCTVIYESRRFDAAASQERMVEHGTTVYNGAPPHFALMCDLPATTTSPALEMIVSGGSALTAPLYRRMRKRWPDVPIANWYGLNESGIGQTLNHGADIERDPEAVGREVWPTEVRVIGEDGRDVEPGIEGELWTRAPGQMREYFRNPGQTARRLHDGWLRTGDRVRMDAEGLIHLVGRDEDRIDRGGFKFYPIEVESALEADEAVREAAVIGVPHPVLGEDLVAFIVPIQGQAVDEAEIRGRCRQLIAPNKVPSRIVVKEELPRGAYGKVVRRELSREYDALSRSEGGAE